MRHEVITLPETGVELETYLTDNRAVEPERRRPLVLIFPGGAYAYRSDREAEPVALRLLSLGIQSVVVHYSVAPARYPKALEEAADAVPSQNRGARLFSRRTCGGPYRPEMAYPAATERLPAGRHDPGLSGNHLRTICPSGFHSESSGPGL